jgi:hypothetical protein
MSLFLQFDAASHNRPSQTRRTEATGIDSHSNYFLASFSSQISAIKLHSQSSIA